jgi:hypothetical protein
MTNYIVAYGVYRTNIHHCVTGKYLVSDHREYIPRLKYQNFLFACKCAVSP